MDDFPSVEAEIAVNGSSDTESESTGSEPSAKRGRKVESPLWNYFKKKKSDNVSVCCVKNSRGQKCGHSMKGFFATNLIDHLRRKHAEKFREYEAKMKLKMADKEEQLRAKRKTCDDGLRYDDTVFLSFF